ncbi:hypothetical protein STSP2_00208 [Anaerohalosphaera lusitana]|uniref:PEP-CTERM protein-sorting domain-containing protein n=1 Tax=Anaerohalosphaera lusitana TaxID=1936003 RepID=A0A1U9NH37_9BACT|nr:PEP-CTERM sorting domain-containing protein [Anaerohalosphaera lusitana]AQT67068.1 hypothetical protein STSP2_00208 [Anaerohalosphaera lusitana]
MMKKLMVLALVLGIGSMAAAGLSVVAPEEIQVGDTVTVQIVSDDGLQYDGYISVDLGGAAVWSGDDTMTDITVPASTTTFYGTYGDGSFWAFTNSDTSVTDALTPGTGFEFGLTGAAEGTATLTLYNSGFSPISTSTVNVVPEPMTLGLLGIGGLFLRRRK